ncbi:MAG: hypothetical protein KDK30_16950, partial [Leptospiraceae bacterium]|nr:hypothetical protein [Leptospiraceae bacterium]
VIWGLYYAFWLLLERVLRLDQTAAHQSRWIHAFRVVLTLHIVMLGWIVFRISDLETLRQILNSIMRFDWRSPNLHAGTLAAIGLAYAYHLTPLSWKRRARLRFIRLSPWQQALLCIMAVLLFMRMTVDTVTPFIYFQF